MIRKSVGFFSAVGLLMMALPAIAQTYDIVDYVMLTPGQWKIEQGVDQCTGDTWLNGTRITSQGGNILETGYDRVGGTWVKQRVSIYQVTPESWIHRGWYEYSGPGQGYWWYEPEIVVPRSIELDQPIFASGVVTHNGGSMPYVASFIIVSADASVTTPAGTFSNALKIKSSWSMGGEVPTADHKLETSLEIWAPGLGAVNYWNAQVGETDGTVQTGGSFREVTSYHQ